MNHLLVNGLRTPKGQEIFSRHRHDFVQIVEDGKVYAVDGGLDYARRVYDVKDYTDILVYTTDSHETIRNNFRWGTRGISGNDPLKYILIKDMTESHINAVIEYLKEQGCSWEFVQVFEDELTYRKM